MSRVLIVLTLLLTVACGSSPRELTAPSAVTGPLRIGLAGQSNALYLKPYLSEVVDVPAFYGQVTTIAPCWSVSGPCWSALRPTLAQPLDAVIWSQGESDVLAGTPLAVYAQQQADLVARIRAANKNPRLLVVVVQMGPLFDDDGLGTAYQQFKRTWAASDRDALYVETQDIGFSTDHVHMVPQGYRDLSDRIVTLVKAKTGR